jgi:hypothetical protein
MRTEKIKLKCQLFQNWILKIALIHLCSLIKIFTKLFSLVTIAISISPKAINLN